MEAKVWLKAKDIDYIWFEKQQAIYKKEVN